MTETAKILIVDDDVSFAESNRDLLEAYGYEVRIAHDGTSGLALAREFRPDLVILDVMMATMTEGFDVARQIHDLAELRHTRILLVTGMTAELNLPGQLAPDATWLPVDRILDKPIAPQRLIADVERLLRQKDDSSAE